MTIPPWLDRAEYPFAAHTLTLDAGQMHYIDEGQGRPLVMVHGTPTWSFLYRQLIKDLAPTYRCVAPDHLGFGLSAKPEHWTYRPADHARQLRTLIEHLGLRDIVLVVHDFGGPIGLSYAIEQPQNVAALVIFNTWMWPTAINPLGAALYRAFSATLGRLLYRRMNVSARLLLKLLWGDKTTLTPAIHAHYINAVPRPQDRQGQWIWSRELIGSQAWFGQLWQQRERISDKPALLLWGMRDPTFNEGYLRRWQELFVAAQTVTFPQAGHFVPEEQRHALGPLVAGFLREHVEVLH